MDKAEFITYIKNKLNPDDGIIFPFADGRSSNILFQFKIAHHHYIVKCFLRKESFEKEMIILLKCLNSPLRVPELIYYEEEVINGYNWIVYKLIPGKPLPIVSGELSKETLYRLMCEIGQELSKFHQLIPLFEITEEGQAVAIDAIIRHTETCYQLALNHENEMVITDVISFLRGNYELLANPDTYSLTIKDFNARHFIVDKFRGEYVLKGFVDFEQTYFSNRFQDFIFLYMDYFFADLESEHAFWDGYGVRPTQHERFLVAFFLLQYALELLGMTNNHDCGKTATGKAIIAATFEWLQRNDEIPLFKMNGL